MKWGKEERCHCWKAGPWAKVRLVENPRQRKGTNEYFLSLCEHPALFLNSLVGMVKVFVGWRKLFFSSLTQDPHIKWVYSWVQEIGRIIKFRVILIEPSLWPTFFLLFPPGSLGLEWVCHVAESTTLAAQMLSPTVLSHFPVSHPLGIVL